MAETEPEGLRVEYRCPRFNKLFAVAVLSEPPNGDFIEVACQRCKQELARAGTPVERVIHRFELGGCFSATLTQPGRR